MAVLLSLTAVCGSHYQVHKQLSKSSSTAITQLTGALPQHVLYSLPWVSVHTLQVAHRHVPEPLHLMHVV